MAKRKLQELDDKFKVIVTSGYRVVEAPLPDNFGFTVGSEYTTPFDAGAMSGTMQKLYAVGQISNPVGLRMRKMYANPEPTEISFEMEFSAFYSAKEEVILPVITILTICLGRQATYEDIKNKLGTVSEYLSKGLELVGLDKGDVDAAENAKSDEKTGVISDENGSRIMSLIHLVEAPEIASIRFGNVLEIPNAFLTSTGVQFSNTLDKDGYPMSATVNVTATLQVAPIADDILGFFKASGGRAFQSRSTDGAGTTPTAVATSNETTGGGSL